MNWTKEEAINHNKDLESYIDSDREEILRLKEETIEYLHSINSYKQDQVIWCNGWMEDGCGATFKIKDIVYIEQLVGPEGQFDCPSCSKRSHFIGDLERFNEFKSEFKSIKIDTTGV